MSLLHIFNAFSDMIFVDLTYNFRTINEQDFRYNSEYNNDYKNDKIFAQIVIIAIFVINVYNFVYNNDYKND